MLNDICKWRTADNQLYVTCVEYIGEKIWKVADEKKQEENYM